MPSSTTNQIAPTPRRVIKCGRIFAIISLILVLTPTLTSKGLVGCPSWPFLQWIYQSHRLLSILAKGFVDIVIFVPVCNGALAYFGPLVAAIGLFRRPAPVLLTLLGCALAEMGYRSAFLNETQWAIAMPAWKTIASFILLVPVFTVFYWRGRPKAQQCRGKLPGAPNEN